MRRLRRIATEYASCLASLRPGKQHKLSVLALFKNEGHALGEWVEHYAREGASSIHLVNNNSDDDYLTPLSPWREKGLVHLHEDSRLHAQRQIYNDYLQGLRSECEWLLVCDLDEFIYARRPHHSIVDYLEQIHWSTSCIHLPWKMFGSSGLKEQPESITHGFTRRANADHSHVCMPSPGLIPAKIIARASRIRSLDVHTCNLTWGRRLLPNGDPAEKTSFQATSEHLLSEHPLHLNHYAIQSESLFRSIKMTRGDVGSKSYSNIRDMAYFSKYDTNSVSDQELAEKHHLA